MSKENKSKPLLSVIIPCYRVEKYLDRCMESVVNQTYRNLEIILVDDGSPDSTGNICDEWASRDRRIIVIHKENGGLGFARNSGMEVATGEWIAFVDSDDYILPEMYEKLMTAALDTSSDIAYCGHIKQMNDCSEVNISDFTEQRIFEKDALLELSQGFFRPIPEVPQMLTMSVWHSVYRRNVVTHSFYSEREVGSEDVHFQISAMLKSERVVFIPECLYLYCYNGESLSHTFLFDKFDRYKKLGRYINDLYIGVGKDYRFDYYIFVLSFVSISQVMQSGMHPKDKMKYIQKVVNDSFWNNCFIDTRTLGFFKNMFLRLLISHSPKIMYMSAWMYNIIFVKMCNKTSR